MTTTPRRVPRRAARRPGGATATMALLGVLGITALGGGIVMLVFPHGTTYLPADILEDLPVDSFLVPGLVLGIGFGIGSLVALFGMWRQPRVGFLLRLEASSGQHWSWMLTIVVGLAFTTWMVVGVLLLGPPWAGATTSEQTTAWALHGIYGSVALALLVLPRTAGVRRYLAVADLTIQAASRRRTDGHAQVLVAHGSKRRTTAGLADMVAETLRSRGLEVDVLPAGRVRDVTPYDAVIVGGALRRGRWPRDARRFVRHHEKALATRLVWLFSSGPLDGSADQGDIEPVRQVRRTLGRIGARGHVTFGGALSEDTTGVAAWHMDQQVAGDWRDPDHVGRWAAHVADAIDWEHGGRRLAMSGRPT